MVPTVAVEHEHRWPRRRKLRNRDNEPSKLPRGWFPKKAFERTSSSDGDPSTGVSPMFSTVRCSSRNALILILSEVVSSRSVYGMEKSVGTGTSGTEVREESRECEPRECAHFLVHLLETRWGR